MSVGSASTLTCLPRCSSSTSSAPASTSAAVVVAPSMSMLRRGGAATTLGPLSPHATLLGLAAVCLLVAVRLAWSALSPALQQCILMAVLTAAFFALAASLYVGERGGVAMMLPPRVAYAITHYSALDMLRALSSRADLIDLIALIFVRFDADQTEQLLSRMPPALRSALTTPGAITRLAPPSLRRFVVAPTLPPPPPLRASTDATAVSSVPLPPRRSPLLPSLLAQVAERRVRALLRRVLVRHAQTGVFCALSTTQVKVVGGSAALALALQIGCTRRGRRLARSVSELGALLGSAYILVSALMLLQVRVKRDRDKPTTTAAAVPPKAGTASTCLRSTLQMVLRHRKAVVGASAIAVALFHQRRRLKRLVRI